MHLELDTSLFKKIENINLNQLVFLSLVLDNNQKSNQGIALIVSQVNDREIQDLIERELIQKVESNTKVSYKETDKLIELAKPNRDYFEELNMIFPKVVTRPDGSSAFLKSNIKKCRDQYRRIVGKDEDTHEHIIECLNWELAQKTIEGKLGFLKTMWKWLTTCEWETSEQAMKNSVPLNAPSYGTTLL